MKYLIVTADDVGLHRGMTLGAIRAHRQGIVTACSVTATGREFDHAAELLRDTPALDVGVHLMLAEGRPLTDPALVPTLVTRDGVFPSGYRQFTTRYLLGRLSDADLERELRAQIERVMAADLVPVHLNGHQHVHVLPRVLDVVLRLALEYRIPYVRMPNDRVPAGTPIIRRSVIGALRRLARTASVRARAAGLTVNDWAIGVAGAGHLNAEKLRQLAGYVEAITEIVTHPGVDGATIANAYAWRYDWDAETEALCDEAVAREIAGRGITLVGVRELPARVHRSSAPDP